MSNNEKETKRQWTECLLQEGDHPQTYFYPSHFLTTKINGIFNQIIQGLSTASIHYSLS